MRVSDLSNGDSVSTNLSTFAIAHGRLFDRHVTGAEIDGRARVGGFVLAHLIDDRP